MTLKPDAQGTYNVTAVTRAQFPRPAGPRGSSTSRAGSPQFPAHSLLVSEWSDNAIATYEMDNHGDPDVDTRRSS